MNEEEIYQKVLEKTGDRYQGLLNQIEDLNIQLQSERAKNNIELDRLRKEFVKNSNNQFENIVTEQIKLSITDIREEFKEEINLTKQELKSSMNQLFEKSEFIKKMQESLIKVIEDEVRVNVANAELHSLVGGIIKMYVKDNLKDLVNNVVETLVKSINKKLENDYRITKELTYSINAEVKHTLMKLPISVQSEELIKDRIGEALLKITKKQKSGQFLSYEEHNSD